MVNQPDQDTQGLPEQSGKLVLPAPPNEGQYLQPYITPIRPEQLIRRPASSNASHGLFTRLGQTWRRDPAYWILSLAIVLVVIASIAFVALGASTFLGTPNPNKSGVNQVGLKPIVTPTTPADPNQQPTPNKSGLPAAIPTTALQMTPTVDPNQALSVHITSIPMTVANNSKPHIVVQTSEPGVTVSIQVKYNVAPFVYQSTAHTTNGKGSATLSWTVKVLLGKGKKGQAVVTITARDRTGQTATSQLVVVTVQ